MQQENWKFRLICFAAMVTGLASFGACLPQPEAVSPEDMATIDMEVVREWVTGLAPTSATRYDLRWTLQTQRGAVRGRAALRVKPPDSLRFDYRGPFGQSGAAFLAEREVVWAVPEGEVEAMIPAVPLFWAALGLPRDPPPGTTIYGSETERGRRWSYGVAGDTLEYYLENDTPVRLLAVMRQFGDVLGRVEVIFDEQTKLPTRATLTFPTTASVFVLEVTSVDTTVSLPADVWQRP